MLSIVFAATDGFDISHMYNIDLFVTKYTNCQSVTLDNENELDVLLNLILNSLEIKWADLHGSPFKKYADVSKFRFPEFNNEQFDKFYDTWLELSKRENTMDEYGSLIMFNGISKDFNHMKTRILLIE